MTQAEYEAACLSFCNEVYRPLKSSGGHPNWPAAPAVGADGAACVAWVDGTYRPWYESPDNSGGNLPLPPKPPKKN